MEETLEARVARQFSSLYLTLVSVLVGLVLADLVAEVHSRIVLWPLTPMTVRSWFQVVSDALVALSSWVTYSHLGLLRRRLPTIWDSLDAMLVLVTIPLNAAAGRPDPTAWFFWGSAFSVLGLCAVHINLWQSAREPGLAHIRRLGRVLGPYHSLYMAVPGFGAMAVASHYHVAPMWLQVAVAASGSVAGIVVAILFLREWRQAVLAAPPLGREGFSTPPG
ncbi:MAG: hypothetical protein JSR98_00545 [Proteobacteria bacterium]|nr:hypothetical protein [Pseudomonadota bacterium]